jgi:preprotein translocase subunit SecD
MGKIEPWKVFVILGVCFIGLILALPNMFSDETIAKLPSWMPKDRVTLGLDLQGGSHLLLEVKTSDVISSYFTFSSR